MLTEALKGGPANVPSERRIVRSHPGPGGLVTQLDLSEAGGETYADEAGAPGRTFGLRSESRTAAQTALPGAK